MKQSVFILMWALASTGTALAQSPLLDAHNRERLRLNQRGLAVLGTWAAGNLLTNGLLLNGSTGRDRAFYQMNLAWGAVNLTLAGLGILTSRKQKTTGRSAYETLRAQHAVEQVFLANAALDLAYVTGGFYLIERSNSRSDPALGEKLRGQGQAIVLQGTFLFLFDGVLYAVHRRHSNQKKSLWNRLDLADSGIGVKIHF